jgi:hypothetical protein
MTAFQYDRFNATIDELVGVPPSKPKRTQEDFWREQAAQLEEAIKTRALIEFLRTRTSEEIAPLAGQEFAEFTPQAQAGIVATLLATLTASEGVPQ